jgi:hypothetical protein
MPEFRDVSPNQRPSASNQNALHATVRDLQARPSDPILKIEITRLDQINLADSRAEVNDDPIGTAIVDVGQGTRHAVTTTDYNDYLIEETDAEVKRLFPNIAQRFFSRDDVFGIVSKGSSWVPVQIAGSPFVFVMLYDVLDAAISMTQPSFGIAKLYDWNEAGTALVETGREIRIANMDPYDSIDAGIIIGARNFGRYYIADLIYCGDGDVPVSIIDGGGSESSGETIDGGDAGTGDEFLLYDGGSA